ncbi:tyrosine-type recombinase/integrase [Nitrospirota bacterium]
MGLYRRGKTFWYTISHYGKRIQESTGTDNKRLAERIYSKVASEVVEGRYFEGVRARSYIFEDMAMRYLKQYEKQRDATSLNSLLPYFGGMPLLNITTEDVTKYRAERLSTVKPATVYQELALMRRMFNVARKEWKLVKYNPVADLSISVGNSNARDRWLTMEEEQGLIKNATNPFWLRPLIITALHTGMRKGEILNLKWKDIDFTRKLLIVHKTKNGKKRSIPMSQTLIATLQGIKVIDISGKVFSRSDRSIRAAFDKAKAKAAIEDFRFHDLRHTFATRLVQNGVDIYKVKELLGHKTLTMTMRYSHHYPESLRSSIDVLDVCYNSATVGV